MALPEMLDAAADRFLDMPTRAQHKALTTWQLIGTPDGDFLLDRLARSYPDRFASLVTMFGEDPRSTVVVR